MRRTAEALKRTELFGLAVLVLAVFAVSTGYGIVLPRLPELLDRLGDGARDDAWRARHVAGLTSVSFAAALVAAPLWGRLSDRIGRHWILAMGGVGYGLAFASSGMAESLPRLYLDRLSDGALSAAVAPAALAYVADRWTQAEARARRFAWINGAALAGYLGGPLIGEAVAGLGRLAPFLFPAALSGGAGLLALFACRGLRSSGAVATAAPPRATWRLAQFLAVTAVAAGSVVALEIAVAVPLAAAGATPRDAAWLLSFCGAAMFLTQVILFAGRDAARRAIGLWRPLLFGLALSLVVAPFARGLLGVALVVAAVAATATALNILASYLTSRLAPAALGLGLGLQYAAFSGGQLLGALGAGPSAAVGVPFALWSAAAAAFILTALPRPADPASR